MAGDGEGDTPDDAGAVPDHPEPPADAPSISPVELHRRLLAGEPVRILDVRNRDEVDLWRIGGQSTQHTHVPLSRFLQAQVTDGVDELAAAVTDDLATDLDSEGPITAVCAEGEASDYVAGLLADVGFAVQNLDGGMDAWGQFFVAREIARDPSIVQYYRPATGCLSYVVRSAGEAVVIDPLRAFSDTYVGDATEADADLLAVVDTHVHADHVSGLRTVAAAADARRIVPEETVARGLDFEAEAIADGGAIDVGDATLRAVHLPGHTTDMTGFAVGECLLAGDSLFLDGVARPDLQVDADADAESLARTLHETLTERLAAFDDETLIGPGHVSETASATEAGTYTATLGALRDRLAVFGLSEDAFVAHLVEDLPPPPANADRIVRVNLGREDLADGEAAELELGPNRCGVAGLVGG